MRRFTSVVVAAAGLFVVAEAAKAQVAPATSDEMRITSLATGGVIFDNSIPDGPTSPEPVLVFGGGPAPVAPSLPPAVAITFPGVTTVLLTEPAGAPPEPGETPIIFRGQVVSDAIVVTSQAGTSLPPQVMLVSDGGPDLADLVNSLPNSTGLLATIPETGALQDLSPYFGTLPGFNQGPLDLQVLSDVPEPASLSLLGLGALGLMGRRRR